MKLDPTQSVERSIFNLYVKSPFKLALISIPDLKSIQDELGSKIQYGEFLFDESSNTQSFLAARVQSALGEYFVAPSKFVPKGHTRLFKSVSVVDNVDPLDLVLQDPTLKEVE